MINKIKSLLYKDGNVLDKKRVVLFCLIVLLVFLLAFTLARYAYNDVKYHFIKTSNFYFNCDKLSEKGSNIEMTNWSGVGQYTVKFNMNSYANKLLRSEDDIQYDINFSCSDNVVCSIENNKSNGTISKNTNVDDFTIVITVPSGTVLHDRDAVELNVEATSTVPYVKKLKGTFRLVVGHYGLSYEIDDVKNKPYLNVRLTNTLDYYEVKEAFGSYNVGAHIDIETYQSLNDVDKNKCASAIITLNFDPNKILLDMTSEVYQNSFNIQTVMIDNYEYVKGISFKIDAMSSNIIKFYKVDVSKDYTYPNNGGNSIVEVIYS